LVMNRVASGAAEPPPQGKLRRAAAPQRFLAAALRRRTAAAAASCGEIGFFRQKLRRAAARLDVLGKTCGELRRE